MISRQVLLSVFDDGPGDAGGEEASGRAGDERAEHDRGEGLLATGADTAWKVRHHQTLGSTYMREQVVFNSHLVPMI